MGLLISDLRYTALAKITKDYVFLQLSTKDYQRPAKTISSRFSCRIFALRLGVWGQGRPLQDDTCEHLCTFVNTFVHLGTVF